MDRYKGRVALVTGASSGIGAAITKALLQHGLTVVGVARRVDKVKELWHPSYSGNLHALQGDISKEEDIKSIFFWIKDNIGNIAVLVNNAGVYRETPVTQLSTSEMKQMIDVNVLALSICTREAVKLMVAKGVDDGCIIHISSILGHVTPTGPYGFFYSATKHAVTALTEGLRKDLMARKSNIRVTSISPGSVITEILDQNKVMTPDKIFAQPYILPEDVADAVVYVLSAPQRVQIHDMIIQPVGQIN